MRHSNARPRRYRTLWPPIEPVAYKPAPSAARALLAVSVALRDGRLEKGPCEVCGAVEGAEPYHHDLMKPLDVSWRCPAHMQADR